METQVRKSKGWSQQFKQGREKHQSVAEGEQGYELSESSK